MRKKKLSIKIRHFQTIFWFLFESDTEIYRGSHVRTPVAQLHPKWYRFLVNMMCACSMSSPNRLHSFCFLLLPVSSRHEDARKALETAREKGFFGKKLQADPHAGIADSGSGDVFRPPEADLDEYHHKATRTLFVGNCTKDSTKEELKAVFRRYGLILVSGKNPLLIQIRHHQVYIFPRACPFPPLAQYIHSLTPGNIILKTSPRPPSAD